ncbi:DUF3833 domain-containing protein [Catenovulum sp. SM1970]|uniref:DUF3833 family protein n=1 Tax=Marinifaba aquimaris TaxID=2741323 RepID=UPI001573D5DC|nr:DUF3833 family protein [Marinifaba aquimaris]NTS77757.1 DUF3833 domain-containing protein [Marinifaba aquimaris]
MNKSPLLFLLPLIASCSSSIKDHEIEHPKFILERYFDGQIIAHGIVQDYSNKLTRHFCVEINASWQQNDGNLIGTLDEEFYFNDGERQNRIWTIEKLPAGDQYQYRGLANDVPEYAYGKVQGNAFHWQYNLTIPIKDDSGQSADYEFAIDDWLYQLNNAHVFNRTKLIKFGMTLGEISIFFDKATPHQSCEKSTTKKAT